VPLSYSAEQVTGLTVPPADGGHYGQQLRIRKPFGVRLWKYGDW